MKNAIINTISSISASSFAFQKTTSSKTRSASQTNRTIRFASAIGLLILSLWIINGQANAASFLVNTAAADLSDINPGDSICNANAAARAQCTLRAAIEEANALAGVDDINFAAGISTVNLTIADLYITAGVNINGPGARLLTIQRGAGAVNSFRIFWLQVYNSTVNISGLTVANGLVPAGLGGGAGILNNGNGTLNLNAVTVRNNTSSGTGGGIYHTSMQNSNARNSIIAANTAPFGPDVMNAMTSLGNNLVGISAGNNGFANNLNGDKVGTDIMPLNPLLGLLQDNGGQTDTRSLAIGSPAADAGNNCVINSSCPIANPAQPLAADQRGAGFIRPRDGNNDMVLTIDIGAFEIQSVPTAASVQLTGQVASSGGKGVSKALVYLTDQNGETRTTMTNTFGYFRFNDVQVGATYFLNVFSKRYTFQPQVVTISGEASGLSFVAPEQKIE